MTKASQTNEQSGDGRGNRTDKISPVRFPRWWHIQPRAAESKISAFTVRRLRQTCDWRQQSKTLSLIPSDRVDGRNPLIFDSQKYVVLKVAGQYGRRLSGTPFPGSTQA